MVKCCSASLSCTLTTTEDINWRTWPALKSFSTELYFPEWRQHYSQRNMHWNSTIYADFTASRLKKASFDSWKWGETRWMTKTNSEATCETTRRMTAERRLQYHSDTYWTTWQQTATQSGPSIAAMLRHSFTPDQAEYPFKFNLISCLIITVHSQSFLTHLEKCVKRMLYLLNYCDIR